MSRQHRGRRICVATAWVVIVVAISACAGEEHVLGPPIADVPDTVAADADDATGSSDASTIPVDAGCTNALDCPTSDDPCRSFVCHPELDCLEVKLPDGAICKDDDACTNIATCQAGKCVGEQPKICNDDNPCTDDGCDGSTGECTFANVEPGGACDDGDVCKHDTVCDGQGVCSGGKSVCACTKDLDCAPFDDGDACNGVLYCDTSATPAACAINPATIVLCSAQNNTACVHNACDTDSGKCSMISVADKTPCTDDDVCTAGDWCQGGKCEPGIDICCKNDADCMAFDDGDLCNGTMFCNKASGQCLPNPKSVVVCKSVNDTACLANTCDKKQGKCGFVALPDGTTCTDANPCTVGDICGEGACVSGPDTCFCKSHNDCLPFDDGNLCNGTLICNKATGKCQSDESSVVNCQSVDDTACRKNLCDPKKGLCTYVDMPDSVTCDADGTICTKTDRCKSGSCIADANNTCDCKSNADCTALEDGDLCNGELYCDKKSGKCELNPASIVYCPTVDDTDCAVNKCQPKTGKCAMVHINEKKSCNGDDNPCTPTDLCVAGKCLNDANVCKCQTDGDCAPYQDTNKCNGELFCDKKTQVCVPNPATVPECPTWQNTACLQSTCVIATGKCQLQSVNTFKSCDADGNVCTAYDTCKDGQCIAGANLCKCDFDADCTDWNDSDPCNGTLYCDKGKKAPFFCEVNPASKITCSGGDPAGCKTTVCDPALAKCVPGDVKDTKPCNDGNPCTVKDDCEQGSCAGKPKVCPGAIPCMVYFCLPGSGLCSKKVETCDDGSDCTTDSICDPKTGCTNTELPDGKACNDGDICTPTSACKGGKCLPPKPSCDDDEGCTIDSCDVKAAKCLHKAMAEGAVCDDGSVCTPTTTCVKGKCTGKTQSCDDGNVCTADLCNAKEGCSNQPNKAGCSDGDKCTTGDVCSKGKCIAVAKVCDDGNACTNDSCKPSSGSCVQVGVTDGPAQGCKDADPCLIAACKKGICGKVWKDCNDDNGCTDDSCDNKTGKCVNKANSLPCDDGDACSGPDLCAAGACQTTAVTCTDGGPCKSGGCDAKTGKCVYSNKPDGASSACNAQGQCATGACVGGACSYTKKKCDDGNVCTDDTCDPKTGCGTVANQASCSDGDKCTTSDVCSKGKCAGAAKACGDGNACTSDGCESATGDCTHNNVKDGQAKGCTDADLCLNAACSKGVCGKVWKDCNDNNKCTDDSCDSKTGKCVNKANNVPCDDGNACTGPDACAGGSCQSKAISCSAGGPCKSGQCEAKSGNCVYTTKPDGVSSACSDGNGCTIDSCKTGNCVHSKKVCKDNKLCTTDTCAFGLCKFTTIDCDDGNPCTVDACDPKDGGCKSPAVADGPSLACNAGGKCDIGSCVSGVCNYSKKNCDDANGCTTDSCEVKTGDCKHAATTAPCNDNNACTVQTACKAGKCAGGKIIDCDDNNLCTIDTCNASKGCQTKATNEGKACDDGLGCTLSDLCQIGVCAGTGQLYDNLFKNDPNSGLYDVASAGDGTVVAVGRKVLKGETIADAWVVAMDATGKVSWSKTYGTKYLETFLDVAPTPSGGWLLSGIYSPIYSYAWAVVVDAKGDKVAERNYSKDPGKSQFDAGVANKDGYTLAGHRRTGAGSTYGWLIRTDEKFLTKWSWTNTTWVSGGFADLVKTSDGGYTGTGYFGITQGLLHFDGEGKLLWSRRFPNSSGTALRGLAYLADGGYAMAGRITSYSVHSTLWVLRTDALGQLKWRRDINEDHNYCVKVGAECLRAMGAADLTATPDGGLAVVATGPQWGESSSYGHDGKLIKFDGSGVVQWVRRVGTKDRHEQLKGVTTLPDGGLAVVGYSSDKPTGKSQVWQALAMRTDRWGHADCVSSGVCYATTGKTCQDGTGCTYDRCDGKKGCQHGDLNGQVTVDGKVVTVVPCDDEQACTVDATCWKGKCQAGKPILGSQSWPDGATYAGTLSGAAADHRGGYLVAGTTQPSKGAGDRAAMARYDAAGKKVWGWTEKKSPYAVVRDVAQSAVEKGYAVGDENGNLVLFIADHKGVGGPYIYKEANTQRGLGITVAENGRLFVVGDTTTAGGTTDGLLWAISSNTKPAWKKTFGVVGHHDRLSAVASGPASTIAAVGRRQQNKSAWWVLTDANGVETASGHISKGKGDCEFGAAARSTSGHWVMGGTCNGEGLLAGIDAAGKVLWSQVETANKALDGTAFRSLISLADGGTLALVDANSATRDRFLLRHDAKGKRLEVRPLGTTSTWDRGGAMALAPGRGLVIVGDRSKSKGGPAEPTLLRTDNWGRADCNLSGVCTNKTQTDCDDGKPCTTDACDAAKGCTHTAIPGCP